MAAPIGPGDWVECVDSAGTEVWRWPLTVGRIYRVLELLTGDGVPDALQLVEIGWAEDGEYCGFAVERFRPIYRPKSSIIEQLKQPVSEPVRELLSID